MSKGNKKFKCIICNEVFEGETEPNICPVCGAKEGQFVEIIEEKKVLKGNTDEYFVIVGNGASGFYATKAIRERNKTCKITIISNEQELTYFRPSISDKINEEINEDFYVVDKDWYEENNINLVLNTNVDKIDEENKTIILDNEYSLKFDKLIIATGSKSFLPPIQGNDLENVFTLRNTKDLKRIKKSLKTSKKVVVIGGGLLGLEAAWEFKLHGAEVVVVDNSSNVLSRQLDKEGSKILQKCIEDSGIEIKLEGLTEKLLGNKKVEKVVFKDNTSIECDMVVFSVGVRANTNIADNTSIDIDRGILVNENMQTSVADIYACGDVAQLGNNSLAIWSVAVEMGEVAGANACEDKISYKGENYPVFLEAMNSKVFSIGNINDFDKDICTKDVKNNIYKKIFFKENIIIGAIFVNDLTSVGKVMDLISQKADIENVLDSNIL